MNKDNLELENVQTVLVSSCVLGVPCRYDGKGKPCENVIEFCKGKKVIQICPEQVGGLSTPRDPAEIIGDKIISSKGVDVTKEYMLGANTALNLALSEKPQLCILKSRSPSCGSGEIYDGTFTGKTICGNGCTAKLLKDNGFKVVSELDI